MDAIVQFIRNALCCIKDLQLFEEYGIHDAKLSLQLIGGDIPEPFHKTTPIEYLICISQFYAFVSCSISGFKMMTSRQYQELEEVYEIWREASKKTEKSGIANRIVAQSIINEMEKAVRKVTVGICVFPIGISFFWLAANSLHVTEKSWIGGLPMLIHALTAMEIFLIPLLYFMWNDSFTQMKASKSMIELKSKLLKSKHNTVVEDDINATTYEWLVPSWSPFWKETQNSIDPTSTEKALADELKKVEANIESLCRQKGESSVVGAAAISSLDVSSWKSRKEGQREFLYFILNFIAFYGYLLGIIAYYYPDDVNNYYASIARFWMTSAESDWLGNFAGDFCWTIEPLIIILSPIYFASSTPKSKVKKE